MRPADFEVYKALLYEKSGLVVTPDKAYLIESRLAPVLKKWNLANLDALTTQLRGVPNRDVVKDIVEAMTTNETSFFRDQKPFDKFRDIVVPNLVRDKGPGCNIRVWSAACSSGQEPYTLAMITKECAAKFQNAKFDFLATDLSTDILNTAKAAKYSQFEVQRGMPIMMLMKYFVQNGETWTLKDEIKAMIRFEMLNLLESFDHLGTFDVIFCRNVLIYFDQPTKAKVLEKIHRRLAKNGYLFLGGAETVLGITDKFKPMEGERGLYLPV